jgi:hypothetical protein
MCGNVLHLIHNSLKTMKKFLALFLFLAVVGFSCQKDDVEFQDAAAKANGKAGASVLPVLPSTEEGCVTIYQLTAGQHMAVGTVEVTDSEGTLSVTYKLSAAAIAQGWYLTETHTYAGSCAGVPMNQNGIPVPGHFPAKEEFTGTATYMATAVFENFAFNGCDNCIYAHAALAKVGSTATETAWGGTTPGTANRWFYYISTYCEKDCTPTEQCTYTQGYWKNHGPAGCANGKNSNMWPVSSLMLGTVSYSDAQLCELLNTSVSGNALISLAHQLIAAKLNVANGADATAVAAAIAAADALIGNGVLPAASASSSEAISALIEALTDYNEGTTGPGHCD